MALAVAALLGAGFVCPPCGGPDHHPCPPIGKQAGEPCGGPCGHLGQCGDGLKCYPRKLKTIRGAVALLGRFGAFLGPAYAALQEELEELGVEAVEDLQELEAEHIETLAAKLKVVQAKKFAKKIAALQAA